MGTMAILTGAGVGDAKGYVLVGAAGCGCEAFVQFLLRQRRKESKMSEHAKYIINSRDGCGLTPLLRIIIKWCLLSRSLRIVRLLVDAGADTTSAVRVTDSNAEVEYNDTPLAVTTSCLRQKVVDGKPATQEQLHMLQAIRRLLLRVDAVRAVSWLWPSDAPFIVRAAERTRGPEPGMPLLSLTLPILKRRAKRRRVLVAALFLRHVYTTPKSFLELLKLYNVLLSSKRESQDNAIERLTTGLHKLRETKDAVTSLEEDLKINLEDAEQKKTVAERIAETVSREKAIVEVETAKAQVQAEQVAKTQAEVSIKQRDTEADLAKAEPAVEAAMAALHTLNKKDLGECKTMGTPPKGVDDVFAATMVLLAGASPSVITTKAGKVKDRSWDAAKKQLLGIR